MTRWPKSSPPRKVSPFVDFLEDALGDVEDRDVEGAATEVVDRDFAASLFFEPVGECGGGRLVDDPQHFEPGDPACILGRLALRVIEVGGDGDNRLHQLLAEIGFGRLLHLGKDEGTDLTRAIALAAALDPGVTIFSRDDLVRHEALVPLNHRVGITPPDQALDREYRILRVVIAWRLAGWPISTSPPLVNATTAGVVREPSAFSITLAVPPSMTATHEFVVPRSIPMTLAIQNLRRLPSSGAAPARSGAGAAHPGWINATTRPRFLSPCSPRRMGADCEDVEPAGLSARDTLGSPAAPLSV